MYGDREREGEGEGEEGVSRNDGGKYKCKRKVMEVFILSVLFFFLLSSFSFF